MNKILKIIIIGPTGVGKSTLLNKITGKYISDEPALSTIGVDFGVVWDDDVKLQFWDTAGQERFRSIINSYYRNTAGCLIVYDVANPQSFQNIKQGVSQVLNRMSYASTLSHLRRINTAMEKNGKLVQEKEVAERKEKRERLLRVGGEMKMGGGEGVSGILVI